VQITGGSALSKNDIGKMVRDAEEECERREEADVRNPPHYDLPDGLRQPTSREASVRSIGASALIVATR
jgi:hypothetical protein